MPIHEATPQHPILKLFAHLNGIEKIFKQTQNASFKELAEFKKQHAEVLKQIDAAIHGLEDSPGKEQAIERFEQHKMIGAMINKLTNVKRLIQPGNLEQLINIAIGRDLRTIELIQHDIRNTKKADNTTTDNANDELNQLEKIKIFLKDNRNFLTNQIVKPKAIDKVVSDIQENNRHYFEKLIKRTADPTKKSEYKTHQDNMHQQLNDFRSSAITEGLARQITRINEAIDTREMQPLPALSSMKTRPLPATPTQQSMKAILSAERESTDTPDSEIKPARQ